MALRRHHSLPERITPTETYILLYIWANEPCRTRDLCRVFRCRRQYLQRLLSKWSQLLWRTGSKGGLRCSWCYMRCRCPRTCWGFRKPQYRLASPLLLRAADYFRRYPRRRSVRLSVLLRGVAPKNSHDEDRDFYCQLEHRGSNPRKLTILDQFIAERHSYYPVDVG